MQRAMNSRTAKRLDPILSDKDRQALMLLWRHRIATFQGLKSVLYPSLSNERAYYILRRLKRGQYVRVEGTDGPNKRVWMLDQRGFKFLVSNCLLPDLKAKGYRPQRAYHDLLVSAVLMGDWAISCPRSVRTITEQEMTATECSELPKEIRSELEHQPDGIWLFESNNTKAAIGLEVELTAKASDRYEQICAFYTGQLFFKHVVWIVESKALGQRILDCSQRLGIPREGVHLFLLQQDLEKNGWDAKFLNSSMKDKSLANLLCGLAGIPRSSSSPSLVRPESASNPSLVPQTPFFQMLDFSFSLGNLKALKDRHRRENF